MTNFSNLEYEFIDEERRSEFGLEQASFTSTSDLNNTSQYACIIDRNRTIKPLPNNLNIKTKSKQFNLTPLITTNMNLFYELMQSMPEISKMQIK